MGLCRSMELIVAVILGWIQVARAGCFSWGSTSAIYCCGGGDALSVNTDTLSICSDGTCVSGNSSTNVWTGVATWYFDSIVIRNGTAVTVSGRRALQLISHGGITIDGGTFNATADSSIVTLTALTSDCGASLWDATCKSGSPVEAT